MDIKTIPEAEKTALYFRALKQGESLMPCDVAKIIGKTRVKKYGIEESKKTVIEIMERCGFYCDDADASFALETVLY